MPKRNKRSEGRRGKDTRKHKVPPGPSWTGIVGLFPSTVRGQTLEGGAIIPYGVVSEGFTFAQLPPEAWEDG